MAMTTSFGGGASKLQLQAALASAAGCDSHSLSPSSPCLVTPEPSLLCTVLPRCGSSCALLPAGRPAGGSDIGSPAGKGASAATVVEALEALPTQAATPDEPHADAETPTLSPPQLLAPQHRSPMATRQAQSCSSSTGAKPCRSSATISASSGLGGIHRASGAILPSRSLSHMSSPDSEDVSSVPRGYHSYASTPSRRLPWRGSTSGGLAAAAFTNPLFDASRSALPSPLGLSTASHRGTAASSSACASTFASPTHHHSSYLRQQQLQAHLLHQRHSRLHYLGRRDQDPRLPSEVYEPQSRKSPGREPGKPLGLGAGGTLACASAAAKDISASTLAATLPLLRGMGRRSQRDQGALVGALALLLGVGAAEPEPDELDQDDVCAASGYSSDVGMALDFGDLRWRHMGGTAARARVSSAGDLSSCVPADGPAGRRSATGAATVLAPAAERDGDDDADAADITAEITGSAAAVAADSAGLGATLELLRYAASLQQQVAARNRDCMALRVQLEESFTAREEMGAQLLSYQQRIIDLERRLEQEKRGRAGLAVQSQLLQQELQEASEVWRDVQELARAQSQTAATPMSRALRTQGPGDPAATAADADADVSGGAEQPDLRDAAFEALRRENESLTSRLIASSLMAAEAVEREEEARHQAHILQELNNEAMQSVNALSLELSLLRTNAGNTRPRRFNLPWGNNSSGGSAWGTSGGGQ
ncbi:hypothetical protein HXX76_006090 [Chlamydomonas incerta]|uniref:Uncharacterized protein n=1 Tax=Chlamydomonas incerta TaxID=51695 RepID=A0A835W307_CHLIN|nr:hypothetical protein HXX76_006090 [Chlamydomonas incerta]|eukprot:KAG2437440.1 hypothetical protein HXX76_006090 [Chlamydomonas incerta]